jgi:serine/threonine-protein kinase
MIGEQIGQYKIVELIAQGGMATVYKAYQESFERYVAIKVLPRQLSEDPTFLKRFQNEARVIARLEHRSILPVYDYGEHDGMPYIVMRLVETGTLRKKLFYEQIDLQTAARIIEQVAEALDYAHAHGVIHRDLKPSNILLDERNNAYLTDFGIAKMLGSTSQVTGSGVVGTPSYMSPEQCQGKTVTPASDIYALGAILYEVVTGKAPFEADTPLGVMYMHVRTPVPSVQQVNPSLPAAIDRVIARAMAKRPFERYSTASELAADFWRAIGGPPLAGEQPLMAAQPEVSLPPTPPPNSTPYYDAGSGFRVEGQAILPEATLPDARPAEQVLPRAAPAPKKRLSTGMVVLLAAILGLALILGAAGIGLVVMSWLNSDIGSPSSSTMPSRTPQSNTVDTPVPLASPTLQISTQQGGGIIEPTVAPTNTAMVAPPSSTPAPLPPTQTPLPVRTNTPLPTSTPTPYTIKTEGWLAYTQGSGDSAEIVVIDTHGENRRPLTANNWYDGEPDWSPDGTRIAFESSRNSGVEGIFVMTSSGSDVRQLTTSGERERHPDWSPDGGLIAFEVGDGDNIEIYVMNADGTGRTRLTNNNYGDRAPHFSPDGTRIAYMTEARGKWEIAIMDYPSGEVLRIFDCPAPDCRFPAWSPDGTRIAYNTLNGAGTVDNIWVLDVATGQSTLLIQGRENGRPVWSGDGAYIFFNRTVEGNTDLYAYEIGTGTIQRLTTTPSNDYGPDWGPR